MWSEKRAAERARNDAGGHLFPDVGAHGTIAPVRQHAGKGCEQDGGEGCTKRQVLRRVHGKPEAVEKYVEQGHDDHRPADTEKPGKEPHKDRGSDRFCTRGISASTGNRLLQRVVRVIYG